jgi:long-chain acyl-CoA synthetase
LTSNICSLVQSVAAARPQQDAVRIDQVALSYASLMLDVAELAGRLRSAGVEPGDRVAIFAENCPEYLTAFLASARLGAIFVPINPSYKTEEVAYALSNCSPTVALVEAPHLEAFRFAAGSRLDEIGQLVTIQRTARGTTEYANLPAGTPVTDDWSPDGKRGALIHYTSGTSSTPKPVFLSHEALVAATTIHRSVWHLSHEDRLLVALPMSWAFGLVTAALSGLTAGATLIVMPHFNPVRALDLMEAEKVTVFMGVGTMYVKLVQASEASGRVHHLRLRLCLAGGEARNEPILAKFVDRLGCRVHDVYAASECFPLVTSDPVLDPKSRPGSAGKLVPGARVRLVDEAGNEVPPGEVGELLAHSPGQMLEYFREPELTANAFTDGMYRMRDLVRIDEDGYFYVVGRASEMIIRGGANVSPAELEGVLLRHDAVSEAAVIGVPDQVYGEQVVAFVTPGDGKTVTVDELLEHCAANVASYKVPAKLILLAQMPKGATGKVAKAELKKTYSLSFADA